MNEEIKFMIASANPPKVELTDAGLYIRFQEQAVVDQTVLEKEWPHVAVDLDLVGNVIGIEVVPAPENFSIGAIPAIVANAKVAGMPLYDPAEVQIQNLCLAV